MDRSNINTRIDTNICNKVLSLGIFAKWLAIAYILMTTSGLTCRKFVEVENPPNQEVISAVFSNDGNALTAIAGLYSRMTEFNYILSNGGITLATGLSSDEIFNRNSNPDDDGFKNNSIPSSGDNLNFWFWQSPYTNIYQVNSIIEGLNQSLSITPALKSQLTGEAKFIRAFYYFYMVNLFGDVPLIISTDYTLNATMPRTPRAEVYSRIVTDLLDAKSLLNNDYPSADRARPNKLSAAALLSRVYLYQGNYAAAESEASLVISSGSYSLEPDLNNVFLPSSNETIFQFIPSPTFNSTPDGLAFVPGAAASSRPAYLLTDFILNAFDSADQRKEFWVHNKVVNGITYNYAYKYKIRSSPTPATEYYVVLRLAEQYLIRAEAMAEQDNVTGARSDINIIRSRAGLPATSAGDKTDLLMAVLHERQVEFFAEWGHRWFDLIRTGKADAVLGMEKAPFWSSTDTLYPIPLNQLKVNPFLIQNPGY